MKRIFGLLVIAAAFLGMETANATITTIPYKPLVSNSDGAIKGVYMPLPAMAQNDSAEMIFSTQGLYSMEDDGADAWNSNIMWGSTSSTSTDSFTVNIQGAFASNGTWTSIYAGTLQANTVLGSGTATNLDKASGAVAASTGMYQTRFAAAATTLLPFPYMRVQIRLKGSASITAAQGKRFVVIFPQVTYRGRPGN